MIPFQQEISMMEKQAYSDKNHFYNFFKNFQYKFALKQLIVVLQSKISIIYIYEQVKLNEKHKNSYIRQLQIYIMDFAQNKIYYKGNPHTRQNYIPNSAQKNRMKSHFLVQFPQGNEYFESSRKKQYANKHNQSQIKNTGIFQQQASNYNHGTLYVSDIQGAIPNSLVSQAIKNRIKGQMWQNSLNSRASQRSSYCQIDQANEYFKQKQQLKKKSNQIVNYHLLKDKYRVQTQPAYQHHTNHSNHSPHHNNHYSPSNHIHRQLDFQVNPQYRYVPETTQTDNINFIPNPNFNPPNLNFNTNVKNNTKIDQLEQRLFTRQQNKLKPVISIDQYRTKPKPSISIDNYKTNNNQINRSQPYDKGQQKYYTAESAKKLEVLNPNPQAKYLSNNAKSAQEIKQMWHGDHHKLRLFPYKEIRKFSPTYMSTQNILHSEENYSKYVLPKIK